MAYLKKVIVIIFALSVTIFLFAFYVPSSPLNLLLTSAAFSFFLALSMFIKYCYEEKNSIILTSLRGFYGAVIVLFAGYFLSVFFPYALLEPIFFEVGGFFLVFSLATYCFYLIKESKHKQKIKDAIGWFFYGLGVITFVLTFILTYNVFKDPSSYANRFKDIVALYAFIVLVISIIISSVFFILKLKKEKNPSFWWGIIFNIFLILVSIYSGIYLYNFGQKNEAVNYEKNKTIYDYLAVYNESGNDQSIVSRNANGDEEILIPSVRNSLPELPANAVLTNYASPEETDTYIFKAVIDGTDNPAGKLYLYNNLFNTIKPMKINEIYDGFFGIEKSSPNDHKLIWSPDEKNDGNYQTIYLIDLVNDTYAKILELNGNETFGSGGGAMSNKEDVQWLDNNSFKYAVYDKSKKTPEYLLKINSIESGYEESKDTDEILIEYREFNINQ